MAVQDVDLGFKAIVRELKKLDGKEVNAGILKGSGKSKKGVPVVLYAFFNEFGTKHIPARPFVRIASDENKGAWGDIAAEGVGLIIDRRIKAKKCCDMVGKRMKADIKKVIGDKSKLAPNAESTIRRKGHDKPLIDTGLMKKTVNYRVD